MITIKKYPNRRLYNTQTSTYINLDGIQHLIQNGTVVCILDSKTGEDVTTATLLHHVFDAAVLQALVPGDWMQNLMQLPSNELRLDQVLARVSKPIIVQDLEPESETQADERTQPKIELQGMPEVSLEESESESSDSEVTVVRIEQPPTISSTVLDSLDSFDSLLEGETTGMMNAPKSIESWKQAEEGEEVEEGKEGKVAVDPDVGIPSFWSEQDVVSVVSVLQQDVRRESEALEHTFDIDDDLFTQPETIVVRQVEEVASGNVASESIQSASTVADFESISDSSVSFELYSHEEFISKVEILKDSEDVEVSEESNTVEKVDVLHTLDLIENVVPLFDKESLDEDFCEVLDPETVDQLTVDQLTVDQSTVEQRSAAHIEHSVQVNASISTAPASVNDSESSSDGEDSNSEHSVDAERSAGESNTVEVSSTVSSPTSSTEPLSKSEQMQARLEAMKALLRR